MLPPRADIVPQRTLQYNLRAIPDLRIHLRRPGYAYGQNRQPPYTHTHAHARAEYTPKSACSPVLLAATEAKGIERTTQSFG